MIKQLFTFLVGKLKTHKTTTLSEQKSQTGSNREVLELLKQRLAKEHNILISVAGLREAIKRYNNHQMALSQRAKTLLHIKPLPNYFIAICQIIQKKQDHTKNR
jgi:hypothetical protein